MDAKNLFLNDRGSSDLSRWSLSPWVWLSMFSGISFGTSLWSRLVLHCLFFVSNRSSAVSTSIYGESWSTATLRTGPMFVARKWWKSPMNESSWCPKLSSRCVSSRCTVGNRPSWNGSAIWESNVPDQLIDPIEPPFFIQEKRSFSTVCWDCATLFKWCSRRIISPWIFFSCTARCGCSTWEWRPNSSLLPPACWRLCVARSSNPSPLPCTISPCTFRQENASRFVFFPRFPQRR